MLRLQGASDSSSGSRSRMRSQQKPADFLARNKKAVRDKSKAETAKKDSLKGEQAVVHPPRHRAQPAAAGEGQVVITQTQLDQLLRMSFAAGQERGVESKSEKTSDKASHVVLEASQVPGLAEDYSIPAARQAKARERVENRAEPVVVQSRSRQPPVERRELSQQEQWLRDLEEQAAQRRRQKEEENLRRKEAVVEDYNPWGRPGCGAPIRSQSGHLLTDYRQRQRVPEDSQGGSGRDHSQQSHVSVSPEKVAFSHVDTSPRRVTTVERSAQPQSQSLASQLSPPAAQSHVRTSGGLYSNTPQFARGAGPFVDQYVLQEKAEQRKKQLEHVAFLREQVAAKERLKLEEKLLHEREEKEEENRIARERERIRRQNEQEAERARRKEAEAKQYNLVLQRRRAKAEESAQAAKQLSRKTPTSDTAAVVGVKTKSRNIARNPAGLHADSPPPSPQQHSYRKRESGARGNNPKPSRIPMRRNSTLLRKAIRRDRETKAIPPTPPPARAIPSPPVPVVAARMRQGRRKGGHHLPDIPTPPPPVVRSRSPPVPALAKKLALSQHHSPPPPPPQPQRQREVRSRSPPVPALAKKLQNGITWESESGDRGPQQGHRTRDQSGPSTTLEHIHEHDDSAKAVSFSTSVKDSGGEGGGGGRGKGRNDEGEVAPPTLHLPPLTDSNHEPPPLTESARNLSPSSGPHVPPSLPRQQQIIQELAMLREGILSHKCGLDDRVQRIITRKPCPF